MSLYAILYGREWDQLDFVCGCCGANQAGKHRRAYRRRTRARLKALTRKQAAQDSYS